MIEIFRRMECNFNSKFIFVNIIVKKLKSISFILVHKRIEI